MTTKKALDKLKNQRAFLAAFRRCGRVDNAAEAAGITRQATYLWLKDPEYVARYEEAKQEAAQLLVDEATRRAVEGTTEDVYYQGRVVGTKLIYSDILLMFLIKGLLPETYRERYEMKAQVATTTEQPPEVQMLTEVFTLAELKRIQERLEGVEEG